MVLIQLVLQIKPSCYFVVKYDTKRHVRSGINYGGYSFVLCTMIYVFVYHDIYAFNVSALSP